MLIALLFLLANASKPTERIVATGFENLDDIGEAEQFILGVGVAKNGHMIKAEQGTKGPGDLCSARTEAERRQATYEEIKKYVAEHKLSPTDKWGDKD